MTADKTKRTPYCPPDVEAILDDFARKHGERFERREYDDGRPSDWRTNPDYYTEDQAKQFEDDFGFSHAEFGDR